MAYHLYVTEALVMRTVAYGESEAQKIIFTKDLGLIRARVQSIRRISSRLRFSLQDFNHSKISFVHGKGGWKIVSAKLETDLYSEFKNEKEKVILLGKIFLLTERLTPQEEKNSDIYNALLHSIAALKKYSQKEEIQSIECMYILKLLHYLGYLSDSSVFKPFIETIEFNETCHQYMLKHKTKIIQEINKIIKETHLL